jgi:signal transduction histidine kinase
VDAFGGPGFRDRFTDAVWQGPTWSFAILLFLLDVADTAPGAPRLLLVGGLATVMVVTLLAIRVRWHEVPVWRQALLPLGDLVGAGAMTVAVPAESVPFTVLLCALPAVWLAFEFGRTGAAAAAGSIVLLAVAAFLLGRADPGAPRTAALVVPVLFLVGLVVVAHLMSRILDRIGAALRSQTARLTDALDVAESRLVVLTGVMESIDAAVTVLRPGLPPLHNARAEELAARAGTSADRPEQPGTRVFRDDGLTPLLPADQALPRALAGDRFVGLVSWVGEPGEQVAVVQSARQLQDADGAHVGAVVAAWDATDLMNAILVREEFVATVSHELRTPLTAITASLELLGEVLATEELDDDCAHLLESCERNAALLSMRVGELVASATAAGDRVAHRTTNVAALVRAALAKHQGALDHAGLDMVVEAADHLVADVDPVRFEQVVDNLVSNAVKYTPAGSVTVTLRSVGEWLVLTVSDTGVGMTKDEQRQAFDRFYRAPRARATAVQGLGIGLSLVKSIAERHGGDVDINSTAGAGTSVAVAIPQRFSLAD